jgi:hypothetical protein
MKYAVEMASFGVIYILGFMKIVIGVQEIVRFSLRNFIGCNIEYYLWKGFMKYTIEKTQVAELRTKSHESRLRHLSNITFITTAI